MSSLQVLKQFWKTDRSKLCLFLPRYDLVWPVYLSKQTQINNCVSVVWKSTTELNTEKKNMTETLPLKQEQ